MPEKETEIIFLRDSGDETNVSLSGKNRPYDFYQKTCQLFVENGEITWVKQQATET